MNSTQIARNKPLSFKQCSSGIRTEHNPLRETSGQIHHYSIAAVKGTERCNQYIYQRVFAGACQSEFYLNWYKLGVAVFESID